MSNFNIPNNGLTRQNPRSDVYGELWATFGMDIDSSYGKMKVSKRLSPLFSSNVDGEYQVLQLFNGRIVAFGRDASDPNSGSERAYIDASRNPRNTGIWTRSYSTSFDVDRVSDGVVYAGAFLLSNNTNIDRYADITSPPTDSWWTGTVTGTALTTGKPHIMEVSRIGQETLFVTDGNLVRYYNATAGHSTVTLPTQLTACALATDYKATWVGTYSNEGNAYVYEIYVGDNIGGATLARNSYIVDGTAVLSMEVIDGVVYIVTDKGKIQYFNGVAFVDAGAFPFAFDNVVMDGLSLGAISDFNTERAIHPKGMRRDGKSLLININTNNQVVEDIAAEPLDNDGFFENVVVNERSASGVWEFNTETLQLTHLAPLQSDTSNGFHRNVNSGPILVTNNQYTRFITTGNVGTEKANLYLDDPSTTPFGYIITKEINSQTIQDAWEKLAVKHNDLVSGENIAIKYRTNKVRGYPKYSEANWTSSTTFVVTNDVSMVSVGDEVEVIDGYGAGKLAHVTSIGESVTTNTITVDTAIGQNTETNQVRFQNWKLATAEDLTDTHTVGTNSVSNWVQFKIVMTGWIEVRQIFNKGTSKTEL